MVAMPTWYQFMAPVLRVLLDGDVRRRRELIGLVADAAGVTEDQRLEQLASGHLRYENRIGWATSYLNRADALERPARGQYMITETGRKLLTDHPEGITERDLRAVAEDADGSNLWFGLRSKSPVDSISTEK